MNTMKVLPKIILIYITFFLLLPINQVSAQQDIKKKIEDYIVSYLEEYKVPGASVALIHNGEVFYSNSWGVTGESEE
ncbi:hypothetical protein MKY04_15050 [Lysinibacillus telephonicus]